MGNATVLERETTTAATKERTHVADSLSKLVWVFLIMSFVGLVGETLQHYVAFNEWESRAGFIWGPLSPIYGTAAVLLTILFERFQKKSTLFLILLAGIAGASLEYFASWAMETYWGVVAWSYLNAPLNFDGRTDVFHGIIWGVLGALWVKVGLPLCERVFDRINLKGKAYRIVTSALSVFLVLDIVMTICVLLRAEDRSNEIPPQSAFGQYIDTEYPTDMLQKRFHNMGGLGI